MSATISRTADDQPRPVPTRRPPAAGAALTIAAFASMGAGAIHATAIGAHREETQAMLAFTAIAVFQLGWGAYALMSPTRRVAVLGAMGNGAALAGWVLAKVSGIWFVNGLDQAEDVQWADGLAAGLAAVALLGALAVVYGRGLQRISSRTQPFVLGAAAVLVAALAVPGMTTTGSHSHEGGEHGHDETAAGAEHAHTSDAAAQTGSEHASTVPPKPYDPTQPIDLGGVEGVTPEQQARAENLIAVSLARLPQFADTAAAEAAGFRSIGDALTGDEHYVNWSYINDGKVLDPDYPESLVYQMRDGKKTLVAAMFMLSDGTTLDSVPDLGGPLTQWHVHDNLCFTPSPDAARVAGVQAPEKECRPGTVRKAVVPMIHVWIVKHKCGPFAALEGIGGGQIKAGETKLCDHAHGAA